jgi:hypothetical protein
MSSRRFLKKRRLDNLVLLLTMTAAGALRRMYF